MKLRAVFKDKERADSFIERQRRREAQRHG